MKILMISESGDGFGIAHKLVDEGHEVKVWVKERKYEKVLIERLDFVSSWRPVAADWADLVVADMVGFGNFAAVLDKFEKPHLGFSLVGDMLELDRSRQMDVFRKFKIPVPVTYSFEMPSEAKETLLSLWTPAVKGWAIKPSGNIETGKTFVVRDKDTMEWALDQYASDQELIAQKLIDGVEISTEGWFNGSDWVMPFNHTMEEKKFLNENLGPNTGCMGNVVWAIGDPDRDTFVAELRKLTPFLKAAKFRGAVDLNMMANEKGLFALELTPRFGYDAIEGLYEILAEPLGKVLLDLAVGGRETIKVRPGMFGVAVRLTVPPYPHDDPETSLEGLPVLGVPPGTNDQVHYFLTDVYRDKGIHRWAAADGVLMKVTAADKDLNKAIKLAYDRVERIKAQGLQYRTDIGARVEKDLEVLENWGYMSKSNIGLVQSIKNVIGG